MEQIYMSIKVVGSEGLGWKCEYSMCGEKYWKLYTVLCYIGVVNIFNKLYFKLSFVHC